jgi:hypothetical protein
MWTATVVDYMEESHCLSKRIREKRNKNIEYKRKAQ